MNRKSDEEIREAVWALANAAMANLANAAWYRALAVDYKAEAAEEKAARYAGDIEALAWTGDEEWTVTV